MVEGRSFLIAERQGGLGGSGRDQEALLHELTAVRFRRELCKTDLRRNVARPLSLFSTGGGTVATDGVALPVSEEAVYVLAHSFAGGDFSLHGRTSGSDPGEFSGTDRRKGRISCDAPAALRG